MSSSSPSPFTLGVNYWPRKKAMAMWKKFDIDEIREDFTIIKKDLGMSLVRIFVLWQDFQPSSSTAVDETALKNLKAVADLAEELKLDLDVTVPTIHMSGPNWIPKWMISSSEKSKNCPRCQGSNPHQLQVAVSSSSASSSVVLLDPKKAPYFNPLHDEETINAQLLLLEKVVTTLADSPSVTIWNLGNEIDLASFARSKEEGVKWAELMSNQIRKFDQKLRRKITCGLHTDSLRFSSNNLPVDGMFSTKCLDFPVMHAYPQYNAWLKDPLNTDFVPFSCILTSILVESAASVVSSLSSSNSFPSVLMEEFGGCTAHPGAPSQTWTWKTKSLGGIEQNRSQFLASEENFAKYISLVLQKLHFFGASGAVLWCFADYHCDIWQEPPCDESYHERFFGLVRPDGSLKPHALVIKKFAEKKLSVKNIDKNSSRAEEVKLFEMYQKIKEAVWKNCEGKSGGGKDWVALNADRSGNNEALLEKVFRFFEKEISGSVAFEK